MIKINAKKFHIIEYQININRNMTTADIYLVLTLKLTTVHGGAGQWQRACPERSKP